MEKTSGIYCIENIINGKKYIGKSINCEERIKQHKRDLKRGHHENIYLQRSYDKNGKESFTYYIIEECETILLNDREIYFIDFFDSRSTGNGFNIENGGIGGTDRIAVETRKKISETQRGISKNKSKKMNSIFVGVSFKSNGWESYIGSGLGNKQIYLGRYSTEEEAALAYDKKALELFGKTYNFDSEYVINTSLTEKEYLSDYWGVTPRYGKRNTLVSWRLRIEVNKSKKSFDFDSEILAAQNYDIYQISANRYSKRINFPEFIEIYKKIIDSNIYPIYKEILSNG